MISSYFSYLKVNFSFAFLTFTHRVLPIIARGGFPIMGFDESLGTVKGGMGEQMALH